MNATPPPDLAARLRAPEAWEGDGWELVVREALEASGGHVRRAADLLGISFAALCRIRKARPHLATVEKRWA